MNNILFVFISNRTCLCLINNLPEGLRRNPYLIAGQFRYIVTLESLHILFRIFLRQDKGFAGLSFRTEVGDIKSGVRTVVASGAEDNPSSVTAPAVIAVCVGTVGFLQRINRVCFQIFYVEICAFMPDMELSVGSGCK